MSHLLLTTVRHFAVHLSGGGVVGVNVTPARHKLPADEVLQNQKLLRGLRHGCRLMLPNK